MPIHGYICAPGEDNYARKIVDILSDPEDYEKVSLGAQRDLYLDWDSVVKEVYEDYCRFTGKQ